MTESASTANNDQDSPGDSFNDIAFRAFMRTASRKSLNNGTAMMKWLEAQERVQDGFTVNEISAACTVALCILNEVLPEWLYD